MTLLCSLSSLLLSTATAALPTTDPRADVAEIAALDRALDSIRAESISADLYFVASDEMEGRDSPSQGLRITARFIRARLQRLGWTPGAKDGYFYEYPLPMSRVDAAACGVTFAKGDSKGDSADKLVFGTDYTFSERGQSEYTKTGSVIFGGAMSEDDVEEIEFEGHWILFRQGEGPTWRRTSAARRAGALGMLIGPAEDGAESMRARIESMTATAIAGRIGSRRRSWPQLYVSDQAFERLLARAGRSQLAAGDELGIELTERRATVAEDMMLENVCGIWPGTDLKDEVIILSAHYDHVGVTGGEIFNGADDNGSGTCGLLAVAEALTHYGPMRRTIMLMWVSAEEKGLLGSAAWTKNPWLPEGMKAIANVNIDMIGRNAPAQLHITPTSEHDAYNGLTKVAERNAPLEGFPVLGSADAYWNRSDHANFSRNMGLPVAFLFSDVHEDYHKSTDTPDKIDYDKIRRVSRLVVRMLHDLQADQLDL